MTNCKICEKPKCVDTCYCGIGTHAPSTSFCHGSCTKKEPDLQEKIDKISRPYFSKRDEACECGMYEKDDNKNITIPVCKVHPKEKPEDWEGKFDETFKKGIFGTQHTKLTDEKVRLKSFIRKLLSQSRISHDDAFIEMHHKAIEATRKQTTEEIEAIVIPVMQKFIDKVDSGRAKSVETYADMKNAIKALKDRKV